MRYRVGKKGREDLTAMDISKFVTNKTGRIIEISGYPGASHTFIPDPLPPDWQWPINLWPLLMKAREELARLDGIGRHLPNPELLLTPLRNREAQRSSSLEGTFAEPVHVALLEVNPSAAEAYDDDIDAAREVRNYARALRLHRDSQENLPISLRLIRELHRILLEDVRRAKAQPGEFRRSQVQVGGNARYVPPPAGELPQCLDLFEKYLYQDKRFDPLVDAFLAHYQFEAIHPFTDGNGRVGRLLLSILIMEWCGHSDQWLYMSAYFDRNKEEYIDRLFRISTEGDWEGWTRFCLEGVIAQSIDAQKRCSALLALKEQFQVKMNSAKCSGRVRAITDNLFSSPVITVKNVITQFKITQPTAHSDLQCLVGLGILSETQLRQRREKLYHSPDIIRITYE